MPLTADHVTISVDHVTISVDHVRTITHRSRNIGIKWQKLQDGTQQSWYSMTCIINKKNYQHIKSLIIYSKITLTKSYVSQARPTHEI